VTAPTNAQATKQLVSMAAPVKIKPLVNVMGMLTRVVTVAAMAIEAKKDAAHLRIFPSGVSGLHPALSNKTLNCKD